MFTNVVGKVSPLQTSQLSKCFADIFIEIIFVFFNIEVLYLYRLTIVRYHWKIDKFTKLKHLARDAFFIYIV